MQFLIKLPRKSFILQKYLTKLHCHVFQYSSSHVRVRFAPSPTGNLHAGGLRTALYNYLFAKSHKGRFILRIEDTDTLRNLPGSIEAIENDLKWLSIIPDESPTCEGSFGPYIQSERIPIYQEKAELLLQKGFAYRCFCSTERLQNIRTSIHSYDNKCRKLTFSEIKMLLEEKTPYCIRMKLPTIMFPFTDLVYGERNIRAKQEDGDFIIIRNNGIPTYHFANVVDDHLMEITHVLRGVEWLSSLSKHITLYRAFQWEPPSFGHLPQVLNPDGSKLSKRQEALHIKVLREQDYLPATVLNFVRMAGGGFIHANDNELYYMPDLINKFSLDYITTVSATLDFGKLEYFGRLEFQNVISNEDGLVRMAELLKRNALSKFGSSLDVELSDTFLRRVMDWGKDRISKMNDLISLYPYLWVHPSDTNEAVVLNIQVDQKALAEDLIRALRAIDPLEFSSQTVGVVIKTVQKHHGLSTSTIMKFLRIGSCGTTIGAPVSEVFSLIGKETTLRRLGKFQLLL